MKLTEHKHDIVQIALKRHRLSPKALAAEVGCKPAALNRKQLNAFVLRDVSAMGVRPLKPLSAVADMEGDKQLRWEKRLIKEAKRLTKAILNSEKALALMEELWENNMQALERLRRHLYGLEHAAEYAFLAVGDWKNGRPIEIRLEKAIAQAAEDAQDERESQLELAEAALDILIKKRVPRYQAKFGTLLEINSIISQFTAEREALRLELENYRRSREAITKEAPLLIDPQGDDLSLKVQKPHSFTAQNLAEEAMDEAKAQRRDQEKLLRQAGRAVEKHLIEQAYDKVLPQLEAGLEPEKPTIPMEALIPSTQASAGMVSNALLSAAVTAIKKTKASTGAETGAKTSTETAAGTGTDATAGTDAADAPVLPTDEAMALEATALNETDNNTAEASTSAEAEANVEHNTNNTAAEQSAAAAQAERAAKIQALHIKANQKIDVRNLTDEERTAKFAEKVAARNALDELEQEELAANSPPSGAESTFNQPFIKYRGADRPPGWDMRHIALYNKFIDEHNGGVPLPEGPMRDFIFDDIAKEVRGGNRK